jgi:hypothetical protein
MNIETIFIYSIVTILSLILLALTFFSYRRYKNVKLLFISSVFFFLFLRGILLSLSLFYEQIADFTSSAYVWLFDLIVLILLYVAYSFKR